MRALALAILVLTSCHGGSSARRTPTTTTTASVAVPSPDVPDGPSFDRDFPDPFVMWTGREYHAVSTTSGLVQLPHLDGPDLGHWEGPTDLFTGAPRWAVPLSTWAPAIARVGDRFLVYFTAQLRDADIHCVGVEVGPSIDGPFTAASDTPLLCPRELGGAIDPSPFVDRDGSRWLLWKNDGITLRREAAIWSQRLSDDGLALDGPPTKLIGTDQNWEFPHVEAPSMVRVGSTYWLAYSGNWWNQAAYGIGLAACTSPRGPCTKPFDRAVLASRPGREGPGGGEFFVDSGGRLLLAYHAWLATPGYPGHRALFIAVVDIDRGHDNRNMLRIR